MSRRAFEAHPAAPVKSHVTCHFVFTTAYHKPRLLQSEVTDSHDLGDRIVDALSYPLHLAIFYPKTLIISPRMAKDSVMASSATEVDHKIPPNHGFNQGGDVILRSIDGIDFSVHSVLLSLASPVFSGMVSIGTRTKKDVVAVGETSQMIVLMLKFIYPVPPPDLSSFEELDQALHVADKYQLDGMKTRLREKMAMTNSPVSIASNPLRALAITIPHGLKEETETAMHSASKYYNFSTGGALVRLANAVPSTLPCIQLIGPLSVRTRVLAEVLFAFHRAPMQLTGDACREFLCKPCETMYFSSGLHSAPEWQARWAYEIFTELQGRPVQEWDPFFELEFFHTAMHRAGDVPILLSRSGSDRKYECECPDSINQYSDDFEVWAWGVLDALTARLKSERLDSYGRLRLDCL